MCHTCRVNRRRHQTWAVEQPMDIHDEAQDNLLLLFLGLSCGCALIVQIELRLSVHLVLREEKDVLCFVFHALHVRLHALPLPPLEVWDSDVTADLLSGGWEVVLVTRSYSTRLKVHNTDWRKVAITFLRFFGLRRTAFHGLFALHDLAEFERDVFEVVHLRFLGFSISFRLPVTGDERGATNMRQTWLGWSFVFIYYSFKDPKKASGRAC